MTDLTLDLATLTVGEMVALEETAGVAVADLATLKDRPPTTRTVAGFAWIAARRADPDLTFDAFMASTTALELFDTTLVDSRAASPFEPQSQAS
jgi:hypothetical protein